MVMGGLVFSMSAVSQEEAAAPKLSNEELCNLKVNKENLLKAFPDGIKVKIGSGFLLNAGEKDVLFRSSVSPIQVSCSLGSNPSSPNFNKVKRFAPYSVTKDPIRGSVTESGTKSMVLKVKEVTESRGPLQLGGFSNEDTEDMEASRTVVGSQVIASFGFYKEDGKTRHQELQSLDCYASLSGEEQVGSGLTIGYLLAAMTNRQDDRRSHFDFSENAVKCPMPAASSTIDIVKSRPSKAENESKEKPGSYKNDIVKQPKKSPALKARPGDA